MHSLSCELRRGSSESYEVTETPRTALSLQWVCVRIAMAGWLHGVFVGDWLFVFPLCGFSQSLFCNYMFPRATMVQPPGNLCSILSLICAFCVQSSTAGSSVQLLKDALESTVALPMPATASNCNRVYCAGHPHTTHLSNTGLLWPG